MNASAQRVFTLLAEAPISYREMMGDLDFLVRIKTEHPDAKTLLEAYGRSVAHGCFRIPAKLSAGRPFVLTFLTKSNVAAVKGTAEVIGHEDNATWVRFLSAADPRRDADIVLTGVKVVIVPSTIVTKPVRAAEIAGAPEEDEAAAGPVVEQRPATRPGRPIRPGSRPGSRIEAAVADVPVPSAAGTGRSEALERRGMPAPQPGAAGSRDARKATPARGLPAISLPPINEGVYEVPPDPADGPVRGPVSGDTTSMRRPAERPSERAIANKRSAERPSDPALRRSSDRQSGSAPAIAAPRARTGRRSAQHPAVRLVTPLSSESAPSAAAAQGMPGMQAGENELSANRTMPPSPSSPPPPHHLADPGYPMVVRTRGPSRPPNKHPRGLPVMPAISVESGRSKSPSYPMHHVPPVTEPSSQLRAVPMASTSAPLPEGTDAERALPAVATHVGDPNDPRKEVSGSLPLTSVVPWWTQPPERAATRSPVYDPSGLSSQHGSAEAAVDFAEASGPDLARPPTEPPEPRAPYPRPPTMAEHAAPAAMIGDERSGRVMGAMTGTMTGSLSAESLLVEAARRSAVVEAVDEPRARRVMWGSIAMAITCVAVAIGAVWWALDLRASAKARKTPAAVKASAPAASGSASSPPAGSASPSSARPAAPAGASAAAVAPPPSCQLKVSASASPASLTIDGKARGETPAVVDVPCGPVAVELRRTRYATATRTVEAKPGVTEVDVRMTRPIVSVRILSRPAGVTVRLNGKDLGKTPLSAEVPAFEHATLIWIAANGATKTQQIYPQEEGDSFTTIMGR